MEETKATNQSSQQSSLFNNWISYFGFALAIIFLVGEMVIIGMDLLQETSNLYVGILIYAVGPAILVSGLLLVPIGMFFEHLRRKRGEPATPMPVIDFGKPSHQKKILVFTSITCLFMVMTMIGSYQAYHLTESNKFCGTLCHQVMVPEYTAYQNSPHARVHCVQCHIGPGASWFVRSKLSGAWQVYAVLTNTYHLPIETPIHNLRPARDTCEQCHWPEKFYQSMEKQLVFYAGDDENTPYRLDLLLRVGADPLNPKGQKGIHWHIGLDHKMEYYASDKERQKIPWIRVTYNDGTSKEFIDSTVKDFNPDNIPKDQIRVMDCIDCHNRPSHRFLSPRMAINGAMQKGDLDPHLPELKSQLMDLFESDYKTTDEAMKAIDSTLHDGFESYLKDNPDKKEDVEKTIVAAQTLFKQNIFPEWNVKWSEFPHNIGHFEFPGCYRCHDDNHKTSDGEIISNRCDLCHTIVRQGEGWDKLDNLEYKTQQFVHPRDFGDDWKGMNCTECHGA